RRCADASASVRSARSSMTLWRTTEAWSTSIIWRRPGRQPAIDTTGARRAAPPGSGRYRRRRSHACPLPSRNPLKSRGRLLKSWTFFWGKRMDQDFPRNWMFSEACEMLARAERLHRQFFQPVRSASRLPVWEPPADMLETEREVLVLVALPGVAADGVE